MSEQEAFEEWMEDWFKSHIKTPPSLEIWQACAERKDKEIAALRDVKALECIWQYYYTGFTTVDSSYRINCVNIINTGRQVGAFCPYCGGKIKLLTSEVGE